MEPRELPEPGQDMGTLIFPRRGLIGEKKVFRSLSKEPLRNTPNAVPYCVISKSISSALPETPESGTFKCRITEKVGCI